MIAVERLTKRYGATVAVADLSFRADAGRVTGFLGPNGAGKSTTLRTLLGLVHASSGSATIGGRPYRALDDPTRQVGALLETQTFHPGRSGRDHLRTIQTAAGLPRSRVDELLGLVELQGAARRRVKGYSLGMRQRLALAAAMLGDPEVLVLDEPANGLDPQGVRWLRDFLRSLAAAGRTVLVSSHVLAEVAQTVDDVVIIHGGRLVLQAPIGQALARAAAGTRVRSPEPERLLRVLAEHGVAANELEDGALAADAPAERIGELAAAGGVVLHELTPERASLEEVFLELTRGEG